MSESIWSPAVVAVLLCGCLPTLGIGVVWSLSVWINGRWDNARAAEEPKRMLDDRAVADRQAQALKVATTS
jgi:hypothetical protein